MQELAGIKEIDTIDSNGDIIYDITDEYAEWDFSEIETLKVTYRGEDEEVDDGLWNDDSHSIEIEISDIKDVYNNPTLKPHKLKVYDGYVIIDKRLAYTILDSHYGNYPDDEPSLNEIKLNESIINCD